MEEAQAKTNDIRDTRIAELVISLADILLWAIHRDGVLEHPMLIC